MLNRTIEFSIRNKLIIALFTTGLIGMGLYQATRLPIDAVPDITDNQVQIITQAPAYGALDIERLVTFPIEQANSNINGIKEIRSFSRFGLSLVTIVFDDRTDVYWARQQVAERLQQVQSQIPEDIGNPEIGPVSTGLGEIYQYVVRPIKGYEDRYDVTELRTIQDWIVRRQLLGVKGVAEVSSFGGKLKQYEIAVDPSRLRSMNLSLIDVFDALKKNNQNTGGAYIEKGPTVLYIRSEGLIKNKEDLEKIPVRWNQDGSPVLLRDVAVIRIGYAPRFGALCYNDQGEVAGAVVMMLKGANSNKVIEAVKERIQKIQKTLPEGVIIEPFLDRTKMVNHAISTVETNLLEGALIVVFILVLFLGNFRAGLLVASVIPLSMLIAIILMNTFGVSGNLMSLGALDFGLIVDGAVIIVEAVLHQIAHNRKLSGTLMLNTEQMDHQVSTSAKKMMNSAVFGQIIILIVYLPIFTLEGIEGKMFKPMAQTVAFALLGAFLLSITYIPMMSAWVLSKKVHHSPNLSDRAMAWLEQRYRSSLIRILHFPKLVLAAVLILFAASVFILSRLGGEFIPSLEEGDFAVDTRVLTGSNLNTTIEYTQKCAAIIKDKFPEVEKVVTKIGSGEVPTDPMPMEASDMMVILKDKKEWTSARNFPELAEKMSEALKVVPGVTTGFQYPVQMRFNELMTGARQDVVCKIFGEDLDSLAALAARLGSVIQTVSGAEDLYLEPVTGLSQIIVDYDRNQLALFRVSVEEVNRCVNTAFAGQSAGLIFEGEKRFDLVVRLDTTVRNKLEDIHNLLIPLPGGNQVPLRQLAKVSLREGPNQIQREDAKRRIVVGFNVRGRDVQSIVEEVQQKVEKNMDLPTGYYITYGGAFENLRQAKARLGIAVPISLVLIFVLLFFAFGSVRQGLIIYTAIPLSAIGGIYFLAIRGLPFSISAGVGFIALFGVAVLNGIVLISEFNRQKESGIHNLPRIVIRATSLRLRPVLMTAMVASMGFLPMAISQGAGAEVQRPLATVVIGGLIIATFLTLYVLPILYMMTERKKHKFKMDASKLALLLPFVLLSWDLPAQTKTLSWKAAVDSAIQNNLGIKNKLLIEEYRAYMTHTAWLIPPTSFSLEAGQLNSAFFDNRIAITQSMEMPRAYRNRKELLKEEWTDAQISTALTESEIRKWVTDLFFNLILQQEEYAILLAADSLNQKILDRAQLRVQEGESALLEQTNASLQSRKLKVEAARLMTEIESTRLKLKQILNIKEDFTPEHQGLLIPLMASAETKTLDKHPEIRSLESGLRMAQNLTAIERSALLPEWQAGYYNQSIRGTGADDVRYDAGARFQAFQIGLAVPLISKAQRNKIRGAEKRSFAAEVALEQRKKELGTELESAWLRYKIKSDALATLDQGQIEDARKLAETASILYDKGEINYVEFSLLVQQSLQVRREYLNAVKDLNNEINLIHYLNSK